MNAAAWVYQPPLAPASHPHQRYYRANEFRGDMLIARHLNVGVELFRFADEREARLKFETEAGRCTARLSATELLTLRDAINDALADIAAVPALMPEEVFA